MRQAAGSKEVLEIKPGQIVGGKWHILRAVGRGGMGAVYEGQNLSIGKRAALKFIDAEFARQPEIVERFQREAQAASLVESAHIVQVFDSGTTEGGLPYIVMELLHGEDLRARLRRLGRLPPREVVHIATQVLRGLHRAHEVGIVHRDLKPDNVFLVDRDDDPLFAKIVDFGVSKITRADHATPGTPTRQGVVLGTPWYMSPEQAQAFRDVDGRTDLWALGAILFECLSGHPPFEGDAYEAIIVAICTRDAPDLATLDPTLPPGLTALVRRALTRDRDLRFQSARQMLEALGEIRLEQVSGPSVHGTSRTRRRGIRGLLGLGALFTAAGFSATLAVLGSRSDHHRSHKVPALTPAAGAHGAAERTASAPSGGLATIGPASSAASSSADDAPVPMASASAEARPQHRSAPSGAPRITTAASGSPGRAKAAPTGLASGVAGGLQIKTSYP